MMISSFSTFVLGLTNICLNTNIVRKSKLLILDEATSAMDIETDTKITELVNTTLLSYKIIRKYL